jgi:hypothetical protein
MVSAYGMVLGLPMATHIYIRKWVEEHIEERKKCCEFFFKHQKASQQT